MTTTAGDGPALTRFTRTAEAAASDVISAYSTSFGLATRLLGARHRQHVRNIYAMVRVADEIVDGVAEQAGLTRDEQREALQGYREAVHRAMRLGYSSDLVIHAFARTAIAAGVTEKLTGPFFASMEADLGDSDLGAPDPGAADAGGAEPPTLAFDAHAHARYVHGSAEVVGLMCLCVFVRDRSLSAEQRAVLEQGAKQLGAAFQNINFLRDLADDTDRLARAYLSDSGRLDDSGRDAWIATVRQQLDDARAVIPLLPRDARAAVRSALDLFAALTARVARTPAEQLYRTRVRVPNLTKGALALRALISTSLERDV